MEHHPSDQRCDALASIFCETRLLPRRPVPFVAQVRVRVRGHLFSGADRWLRSELQNGSVLAMQVYYETDTRYTRKCIVSPVHKAVYCEADIQGREGQGRRGEGTRNGNAERGTGTRNAGHCTRGTRNGNAERGPIGRSRGFMGGPPRGEGLSQPPNLLTQLLGQDRTVADSGFTMSCHVSPAAAAT